MKLRVGLVGLGRAWDYRHRPALLALSDRFEVRAVCGSVAMRAKKVASEFHATSVDGYRALAARDDVDAILMLAPGWYGELPIIAACDEGKAIYCAAALDMEPDQARNVRKRVEDAGIAFMAEFPRRQSPATLRLKELIATRLGPVRLLFCHQRISLKMEQASSNGQTEKVRPAASPITRELIELVDWCRYVVGTDPLSVTGISHTSAAAPSGTDYRMLSIDFPASDGSEHQTVAQISCGHYLPNLWKEATAFRPPAGLQVCCENGVAFVDLPSNLVWFDSAGRHQEALERDRPVGEQLLSQFHRAVTSLVRRQDDLDDAYRALDIVLQGKKSRDSGQSIRLDT